MEFGVIVILLFIVIILFFKNYILNRAIIRLADDTQSKRTTYSNLLITQTTGNTAIRKLINGINLVFDALNESQNTEKKERENFNLALHNIAHDIRTPLTIANGYLQQLISDLPMSSDSLLKIQKNLDIVSKRLEILLEYQSLLETKEYELETINLSSLLKSNILQFYDRLSEENFDVNLDLPDEEYYIAGNIEVFELIIQNVLGNVLKHGQKRLFIKLEATKNQINIRFENDSQRAIAAVKKLTNRFYSENLSAVEVSSGLGLYIVKELVEQTGGEFEIYYQDPKFILIINWERTIL